MELFASEQHAVELVEGFLRQSGGGLEFFGLEDGVSHGKGFVDGWINGVMD
jgi:hypothetical protein